MSHSLLDMRQTSDETSCMEATAELFEVVDEHPKAGIIRELSSTMSNFKELWDEHHGLMTQSQIGVLTGLSRQRIHQLIDSGVLRRVDIKTSDGDLVGTFVAGADVVEWLKQNPRGGAFRPVRYLAAAAKLDS
jgi:hypothetical protein